MSFLCSNRHQKHDFYTMKLTELSEHANQVLTSAQVALGFVMAFNTAILAILVTIGQTINGNYCLSESCQAAKIHEAFEAFLCQPNIIPWAACAILAYIGGRTSLVALEIHVHMVKCYNKLRLTYNKIIKKEFGVGKRDFLPSISDRIKEGVVERIYRITALWFFCICTLFLTCFLASSIHFLLIKDVCICMWIVIPFMISIVICSLAFCHFYKHTGDNSWCHKENAKSY